MLEGAQQQAAAAPKAEPVAAAEEDLFGDMDEAALAALVP